MNGKKNLKKKKKKKTRARTKELKPRRGHGPRTVFAVRKNNAVVTVGHSHRRRRRLRLGLYGAR
jgi:hypothetical protein